MKNTLIYEVNVSLFPEIESQYAEIVRSHISTITALKGFQGAQWYRREGKEEGSDEKRFHWTIHYYFQDRKSLEDYFTTLAPTLRADAIPFGNKVAVTRRILYPVKG